MATTADMLALWADFEQAIVDNAIDQWRK